MISIISVGRNCADNIQSWYDSLRMQTYVNWQCVVSNDVSADLTGHELSSWVAYDHRVLRLPSTGERMYHLGNFDRAMWHARGNIIVAVDLDDRLNDTGALQTIADAYADPDVWMTYGNYVSSDGANGHWCQPLTDTDWLDVRAAPWKTSHVRTFRKSLFARIDPEDFLDWDGKYYRRATDHAMMYPMLEMAGPAHTRFIDRPLYYLNARDKSERQEEIEYEKKAVAHIRSRKPYERLARWR